MAASRGLLGPEDLSPATAAPVCSESAHQGSLRLWIQNENDDSAIDLPKRLAKRQLNGTCTRLNCVLEDELASADR